MAKGLNETKKKSGWPVIARGWVLILETKL
jgi:hypothetical protein